MYPSALPWQQWTVPAGAGGGQVKNLAEGSAACLAVARAPPPPVTVVPVWPIPQHVECGGSTGTAALLSSSVKIEVTGADSHVASAAATRYEPLLQAAGSSGGGVTKVSVRVGGDAPLSRDTDFAYSLVHPAGATAVSGMAATGFGVAHAMETLLQLAEDGSGCTAGHFNVTDAPDFPHRGNSPCIIIIVFDFEMALAPSLFPRLLPRIYIAFAEWGGSPFLSRPISSGA